MLPTERCAYSAIRNRSPHALPGGARLVVWVIVNIEEWNPRGAMPPRCSHRRRRIADAGDPELGHEYGNRVGFWRMLEVLDRARIRAAVAINGGARIGDRLTQRIELSAALSAARSRPAGAQPLLPPKV